MGGFIGRSFKLPVLCSGMVGFGQRRILGTVGKEHSSPPLPSPAVGEVLKPVKLQLEVMDYQQDLSPLFLHILFHISYNSVITATILGPSSYSWSTFFISSVTSPAPKCTPRLAYSITSITLPTTSIITNIPREALQT